MSTSRRCILDRPASSPTKRVQESWKRISEARTCDIWLSSMAKGCRYYWNFSLFYAGICGFNSPTEKRLVIALENVCKTNSDFRLQNSLYSNWMKSVYNKYFSSIISLILTVLHKRSYVFIVCHSPNMAIQKPFTQFLKSLVKVAFSCTLQVGLLRTFNFFKLGLF